MKNSSLWTDAFYRLTRNRAAMFGGFILILLIICAAAAPAIAPYSYSYQMFSYPYLVKRNKILNI